MACRNRVHKNNSLFGHGDAEHTCRVRFSARAINADVAKWQTRLAQTQLEQSIPVQVRSSVSVDLAQLVQHWSRKPAGEMVRREGSTPSVHALGRHGGTGIHTCPRSKRESMWVRIRPSALKNKKYFKKILAFRTPDSFSGDSGFDSRSHKSARRSSGGLLLFLADKGYTAPVTSAVTLLTICSIRYFVMSDCVWASFA